MDKTLILLFFLAIPKFLPAQILAGFFQAPQSTAFAASYINGCALTGSGTSQTIVIGGSPTCGGYTSVTAGDLIVALLTFNGGASTFGVSSTSGVACTWYPSPFNRTNNTGANYSSLPYYCIAPSSGAMTVVGSYSGSSFGELNIAEYSATSPWSWLSMGMDQAAATAANTNNVSCTSGASPAMHNANDLIVGTCNMWNQNFVANAVTGYTNRAASSTVAAGLYDKTVTTAAAQTFTTTQTTDLNLGTVAGFRAVNGAQTCSRYMLIDGVGGTNGNAPTATTVSNSSHGQPYGAISPAVTITGTALKFATAGYHALFSAAPNLCDGGQYTDTATVGYDYSTTTGGKSTVVIDFQKYAGGGIGVATNDGGAVSTTAVASMWFMTTLPSTATANMDFFAIYSVGASFTNVPLQAAGAGLTLSIEAGSGTNIPITTSTWYYMTISWVKNGTGQLQVFDTSGTQVGTTWTITNANDNPATLVIGNNLANSPTTGFHVYFDKIKLCFQGTCSYPLPD